MKILVVHGPNLNLLGEREGDEKGRTLDELNGLIRSRAAALGLEVKIFQSNHEGALVDLLQAERHWADGVLINPAALTHTSYVLREALFAIGKPTLEVHLTDIRRRESWRRKSVIKEVCAAQVMGKGFDSYLVALQRFASGDLAGRKRGPKAVASPAKAPARKVAPPKIEPARKTIGPAAARAPLAPVAAAKPRADGQKTLGRVAVEPRRGGTDLLSRALVRQKIADRLSGKISPSGLATWARSQWFEVQRGAPAESGQRELLEDSLQSLVLSAMPASRMTDDQLVNLMTQLDG